jgi:hypothetical protein
MKTTVFAAIGLVVLASVGESSFAHNLPPEPDEQYLVNEDVNVVNGLYTREYSSANNGIVDYRTARQIISSEYNDQWDTVVTANTHPLFYWVKTGAGDEPFEMWVDSKGDGCTCDIVPYSIYQR